MDSANSSHAENYSVNPFLWGNIALLTSLPWLLAMTMAGLAVGDPVFASWFEISLLSLPAIAVVAWWQWQQPFSPFSLWLVKQSFNSLSDRDRQVLALLKQHRNGWYSTGWIAIAVAIVMSFIFCKLYVAAPLAEVIAPFPAGLRFFGIIWAEIFFIISNAIAQAGISALRIKLTASSDLASLPPIAIDKVKKSFTNLGKSVNNPISQPDSPAKLSLVLEPKSDDLTKPEPEVEEIAEITEPEEIAEITTALEPEVEEIAEIAEPEAIADDLVVVATELEPETNYLKETVINFESDFDIDAEIAKMIAEEEAAKLANMTDWQPEINTENESVLTATELDTEIDEELEELVAFNAYAEQILHNYLIDDPIDEDAISENPDNKTYIATTDQDETKVKPYQILIEEFLVDKYLAKLEELGRTEKLNPENLNPENLQPENNNE